MANQAILGAVKTILQMHAEGLLGGEIMPEDALIGVIPNEQLPDVLTLGMALNYQRSAYALWQAIANAFKDESSRWVFHPVAVADADIAILRDVLVSHRIALQPNRHPDIWQRVAAGIVQSSPQHDVLGLLKAANYDIEKLKQVMQAWRKADFPYLSGPKIFNYWLYVMETYGGVRWKSRQLISIAPDTHILQASVKLGLCSEAVLGGSAHDRVFVATAWETALQGSGLAPIDVHTPLWLWSRAGFPGIESN